MGQESFNHTPEQKDFQILNAKVKLTQGELLIKWFDGDDAQAMAWLTQPGHPELMRGLVTEYIQSHKGGEVDIDYLIAEVKAKSERVDGEMILH